uniref:Uncharacterized protein n=1 Tax=Anguilla anguilla TaxID=7936 RepID=A0A0E9SPF4_ANGAN
MLIRTLNPGNRKSGGLKSVIPGLEVGHF